MKISSFIPLKEPQKLQILHPTTGKKTNAAILLCSTDSKEWRAASKKAHADLLATDTDKDDTEKARNTSCELYAAVTVGWEGFEDDEGKPIEFTKEGALELYKQAPSIRKQVDSFLGNDANFLPKS